MTPKLHDLAEDYLAFSEMLEATDDPESEAQLALALSEVRGGLIQKVDNIVALIDEFEHNAEGIDVQIERMKQRKRRSESKAAWLRGYLLSQLEITGTEHVSTTRFTINVQRTHAVQVENEYEIPDKFKRVVVSTQVNKTLIRNAIERDGEVVPGASLAENKHLRIT